MHLPRRAQRASGEGRFDDRVGPSIWTEQVRSNVDPRKRCLDSPLQDSDDHEVKVGVPTSGRQARSG